MDNGDYGITVIYSVRFGNGTTAQRLFLDRQRALKEFNAIARTESYVELTAHLEGDADHQGVSLMQVGRNPLGVSWTADTVEGMVRSRIG